MCHPLWAPLKNIGLSRFRLFQCQVGSNREGKGCVPNIACWALGTILHSKLLSIKWQEAVSDILSASTHSDASTTRECRNINASISKYAPSEIWGVVDVNQIKCNHFGRVAIFSSTGLLIALVEFRPVTTISEVEVNQWDEFSQFLFSKKRFTNWIATNGALLEGFIFAIGWCKCSTKNEQFGLYGSVGKIENATDEWRNRGANLSLVGCILGESLKYVADNLFQKIQNRTTHWGLRFLIKSTMKAILPQIRVHESLLPHSLAP
ncbi:hypothetical protein O181_097622 [Austropuccinia psidii MF-1]|uniref:Tet-like 2OG-Fe(II) oxygenase domain-containing protein n=1 Tax=Austropuccinia psidii MF-1 TaxID=1389203 RepID=A0A9Q3J8V9_9BASI|nr:hypothetical protein [Austropuccinia psidii MF-1]